MRALVLLGLCVCVGFAAPAPRPKPPQQLTPGWYRLHWGGSAYACYLGRDGFYGCRAVDDSWLSWPGAYWKGSWSIDGERVLTVKEMTPSGDYWDLEPPRIWKVRLDGKLQGNGGYARDDGTWGTSVEVRFVRRKE